MAARRVGDREAFEVFKNAAQNFTYQFDAARVPTVDLTEPVARYFEYVMPAVDLNRDLATTWVELVTDLSGSVRAQAQQVSSIVKDQTTAVADSRPHHPAGGEGGAGRERAGRED